MSICLCQVIRHGTSDWMTVTNRIWTDCQILASGDRLTDFRTYMLCLSSVPVVTDTKQQTSNEQIDKQPEWTDMARHGIMSSKTLLPHVALHKRCEDSVNLT